MRRRLSESGNRRYAETAANRSRNFWEVHPLTIALDQPMKLLRRSLPNDAAALPGQALMMIADSAKFSIKDKDNKARERTTGGTGMTSLTERDVISTLHSSSSGWRGAMTMRIESVAVRRNTLPLSTYSRPLLFCYHDDSFKLCTCCYNHWLHSRSL